MKSLPSLDLPFPSCPWMVGRFLVRLRLISSPCRLGTLCTSFRVSRSFILPSFPSMDFHSLEAQNLPLFRQFPAGCHPKKTDNASNPFDIEMNSIVVWGLIFLCTVRGPSPLIPTAFLHDFERIYFFFVIRHRLSREIAEAVISFSTCFFTHGSDN